MKKYKLTIAYDGTQYSGWQIQKEKISIQETIEKALTTILNEKITIIAAGRTDAQVHALGQTAHFTSPQVLNLNKIRHKLNCLLPKDIRIISIEKVAPSFHARYSAISKIYRYHITNKDIQEPFSRFYSYKPLKKIDIKILKKAIKYFLGTHDFSSFANKQNEGAAKTKPIKTIYRIEVIENDNDIILEFEADGFLYKMVRNIVGTLIDVATKKIPLKNIETIIKAKDRKKASSPAPAHGLFLIKINYNNLSGISSKVSK